MKKTVLSLLVVITLLMGSFSTVFASESTTLSRGEVSEMLLSAADDYNPGITKTDIIKGYEDGQLHEERSVTRAEALVMLKRAFGDLPELKGHNERVALTAGDFTDIPLWAESELSHVFNTGIVAGKDEGIFAPNDNVTREQMELFIERMYAIYGTNLKDDFFATINKEELESAQVNPKYMEHAPITIVSVNTDARIENIFEEEIYNSYLASTPDKESVEYKISALYESALAFFNSSPSDESQPGKDIEPIKEYLDLIDSAQNISELTRINNKINDEISFAPLFSFNSNITINAKDNSKFMPIFDSPSVKKELYLYAASAINTYMDDLFVAAGQTDDSQEISAMYDFIITQSDIYKQEEVNRITSLAETSYIDYLNASIDYSTYKGYDYDEIKALFTPEADIDSVLEASKISISGQVYVGDMDMLKAFADYYKDENLSSLKIYAKFSLISEYGPYLSKDIYRITQEFAQNILGSQVPASSEDEALDLVKTYFGDYIGLKYTEQYFSEESKANIEKMVSDIKAVYETMIQSNTWLSEDTKEKAIEKLKSITLKIGGPDEYDNSLTTIQLLAPADGGTFFENIIAIQKGVRDEIIDSINTPVDKDMWLTQSYTANAFYNPLTNEIIIPAGILQSPFYDENASYEQNLGGLGFIIAHEITHAFDNTGAVFDKDGNLGLWWTEEDFASFENKTKEMELFYEGAEAVPGISTNGKQTLGENISDNGAMSCITLAAAMHNDVPDYKTIYESFAKCWVHTAPREIYNLYALVETHSPAKLRVNKCLSNCDNFYEVYGITEKDGMYIAPENRVKIW